MFLTILNLFNIIFKSTIIYVNFFKKFNNFSINLLIFKSWFNIIIFFLKYNSLFSKTMLIDINTFDYNNLLILNEKLKLNINCLIYYFYLFNYNFKLNIIVYISNLTSINSISNLFSNSLWIERELSEMFGINFLNKFDTRNLLLDYSYVGYPLLKVFPIVGNVEIFFNFLKNWISYINITLKESSKTEFNYY